MLRKRQNFRDGNEMNGSQGLQEGEGVTSQGQHKRVLGGDETVL